MADTLPGIKDVQLFLNRTNKAGLVVDGEKGPATTAAVASWQKDHGLTETGILDPETLAKMFPKMEQAASKPLTIQATIQDYFLNFAQSKIVWVAGALVAAVVAWVNTRFGFKVPPEIVNWVTSGLVTLGGALIMWWRTRGTDTSKIAAVAPAVILDPTKWVGQK